VAGLRPATVTAGPASRLGAERLVAHVPRFAEELVRIWRADRPDVVHAHHWMSGLSALAAVRGLDVNSSYMIYDLINRQKESGVAVVYVGEDLDVLVELCDRILVLCGGKVSGIVDGRSTNKNEVGLMMTKLGGGEA
jgi:hypothetical protein